VRGYVTKYGTKNRPTRPLPDEGDSRQARALARSGALRLVLAPRWPAAPFQCRHPGRRAAPAFATADCESFEDEDRFGELIPFRPQLREHFLDFHASRIAYPGSGSGDSRPGFKDRSMTSGQDRVTIKFQTLMPMELVTATPIGG
jgi:hypothetical protein